MEPYACTHFMNHLPLRIWVHPIAVCDEIMLSNCRFSWVSGMSFLVWQCVNTHTNRLFGFLCFSLSWLSNIALTFSRFHCSLIMKQFTICACVFICALHIWHICCWVGNACPVWPSTGSHLWKKLVHIFVLSPLDFAVPCHVWACQCHQWSYLYSYI
jgi:hypothetical protein